MIFTLSVRFFDATLACPANHSDFTLVGEFENLPVHVDPNLLGLNSANGSLGNTCAMERMWFVKFMTIRLTLSVSV